MYNLYKKAKSEALQAEFGTGWLPPLPDLRDFTEVDGDLPKMTKMLGLGNPGSGRASWPQKVDLRKYCSPIENQGALGSCTAHAAVGVVEYFEKRAYVHHIDGSRLFVYKTTRSLMGLTGDTGAWLRDTMRALAYCGVPPEKYWQYTDRSPDFDKEPTPLVYAVADNFEALRYFSHDPMGANIPGDKVLLSVKKFLAAGIPSMFGFFGFPSCEQGDVLGSIPFPCKGESAIWGHAVVAVGYDDKLVITNRQCGLKTTGALLLRNSWGKGWGDKGYGWLPYEYVLNYLALDFWSLLSMGWVETKNFGV